MTGRFGRIMAAAMALCLFLTSVPVTKVNAEDNTGSNNVTNVIANGSFENISSGMAEKWTSEIKGTSGDNDDIAFDGNTGAVLFAGTVADSKLALTQEVVVSAGYINIFSGKVKITEGTPACSMTVTYYGADGAQIGDVQNMDCSGVSPEANDFTEVSNGTGGTVPEGATKAVISIGMSGVGKCLWDEVKFLEAAKIDDANINETLVNGSFETLDGTSEMPTGWAVNVAGEMAGDGVTVQENSNVLWQTLPAANNLRNNRSKGIQVAAGERYKLTGKLKVMSESVNCTVEVLNGDNWSTVSDACTLTGSGITIGEWCTFDKILTISQDCSNARLTLWRKVSGDSYAGLCYWDDIELRKLDDNGVATGNDLITYGNFEQTTKSSVNGELVPIGWGSSSDAMVRNGYYGSTGTINDDPTTEAKEIYAPLLTGTDDDSNVSLASGKVRVYPGATVSFTADLQVYEDILTANPYMTVNYYDASGNKLENTHTANCAGKKIGEWVKINSATDLAVPTGAVSATITVGQTGIGKCLWDAVTFYATGGDGFTNKLINGSFETDLSGWSKSVAETGQDGVTFVDIEGCVTDGTYSALFNGMQSASDIVLVQDISVTAGGIYNFAAWAKVYAGSAIPYLSITYKDENGAEMVESKVEKTITVQQIGDGGWAEVSENVIVPESAKSATIKVGQKGVGKCLWDDVKLSTLATELSNGSFENIKNGMPADWRISANVDADSLELQDHGIVMMLKKETARHGENSNPELNQDISGLTGSILDGTIVKEAVTYTLKADVMSTVGTKKPIIDINGNMLKTGEDAAGNKYRMTLYGSSFNLVPNKWQEVTCIYKAPSDLSTMHLRFLNQEDGYVYFDNITLYKTDDPTQTNLIANGDVEKGLECWSVENPSDSRFIKHVHYGTTKTASDGMNSAWFEGTTEASKVSLEQTVALDTGASRYTYYANVKISAESEGSPYLTVTHYDAKGAVVGKQSVDCTEIVAGIWNSVTLSYDVPEGAVAATISVGQTGIGICQWDNVKFLAGEVSIVDEKDPADIGTEFRAMLAREEASATKEIVEPWGEENTYEPPYPGQSNLLLNGDFELNDSDESVEYFDLTYATPYCSVGDGEGYDGSDCIKFNVPEEDGQKNPYYEQWINMVGGAEYQVSYKYKVVCTGETNYARPTVKLEYFSNLDLPGAKRLGEKYATVGKNVLQVDGEWHTYTQKVYPDANVYDVKVMVRSLAAGVNLNDSTTVYFDDVEIVMTRPPKPLVLKTDSIFYYSDVVTTEGTNGTITTSIDTGYFPHFENAKIELEIKGPDGKTVWPGDEASKTYTSVDGVVTASFPLSILTKKEQRYEVVATLYNTDGSINQRNVQNIFVYDRPGCLDADGNYHVYSYDEETGTGTYATDVFYPEYAYHCTIEESENFTKLNGTGINLVQMTKGPDPVLAREYLDAMHEQGVMALVCLYTGMKPAADSSNIEMTINIIEEFKDHPAVFGYAVMDEVFLNLTAPEEVMEDSYRLIRSLDPVHPIMTMEAESFYYEACGKYVDILCFDPYATAASQSVAKKTTAAVEAVNNKKPVYALLEAYRNAHGNYPTPNDLRNNIWQALIKDADAVGYYSITDSEIDDTTGKWGVPIWDAKDGGALWQAIKDFNSYERQLAYDHFVFDKSEVYTESANVGDSYWYSSWKAEDGNYYMVVLSMLEDAEATQEVTIPLNKEGDTSFGRFNATALSGRIDEDGVGALVAGKDSLNLTLQGWEAVLFRIDSAEALDVKLGAFDDNGTALAAVTSVGAGEYTRNKTVTVTAPINEGYTFVGWYEAETDENGALKGFIGDVLTTDLSYTFTVTDDTNLTAVYKALDISEDNDGIADSYRIGNDATATITVETEGLTEGLTGIEVNGVALDEANYSVDAEKGEITFTNAYLKTLTAGKHTVKLVYAAGYAETVLNIKEALDVVEEKSVLSHKIGSTGSTAQIYCNGELDDFVNVEVDGSAVALSNYTLAEGSTVLTFKEDYLESLAVGNHTVKLNYTDGSVAATLAIAAKDTVMDTVHEESSSADTDTFVHVGSNSNDTGDHDNVVLWMIVLTVAMFVGTFIIKNKTKRQK